MAGCHRHHLAAANPLARDDGGDRMSAEAVAATAPRQGQPTIGSSAPSCGPVSSSHCSDGASTTARAFRTVMPLVYPELASVGVVKRSAQGGTGYHIDMATAKQKQAARENLTKARAAQRARAQGKKVPRKSQGLSTAEQNRLDEDRFAFPDERKVPIHDATHVRNAVARFDQVEDVSDAERDRAWKRIQSAARKFGVELHENDWRELFERGKVRR